MTEAMPPAFWQGVAQFNQGQFYDCHDTLEALWMEASQSEKGFYQGILQIAVSLYHLSNYNWRGAVILLGEGVNRLSRYEPDHGQINLEQVITQSAELLSCLQESGAEQAISRLHAQQMGSGGDCVDWQAALGVGLPVIERVV